MNRNVVRTVAVALIAFPEPVTTVVGILILSATFAVPRQDSLERFSDLEELVNRSLQKVEPPVGFRRYLVPEQPVVNHLIKPNLSSQPDEIPGKSETALSASQSYPWFDKREVSEKTLHHTLKTSFPQYETVPEFVPQDNLKTIILKNNEPPVEHHKLKPGFVPYTIGDSHQPPLNKYVVLR